MPKIVHIIKAIEYSARDTGAKNAAYLAVQILSVADPEFVQKLKEERADNAEAISAKDSALQESLIG